MSSEQDPIGRGVGGYFLPIPFFENVTSLEGSLYDKRTAFLEHDIVGQGCRNTSVCLGWHGLLEHIRRRPWVVVRWATRRVVRHYVSGSGDAACKTLRVRGDTTSRRR